MNDRNRSFFTNLILNLVFLMIGEGIGRIIDKNNQNKKVGN